MNSLKYSNIKIDDLIFKKITDLSGGPVVIKTPFMCCPFGLDNDYGSYRVKLGFNNLRNTAQKGFMNLLKQIDERNIKVLGCDRDSYQSTIKRYKQYNNIIVKLKTVGKQMKCEVEYQNSKKNYLKTVYDIPKNCMLSCDLELGHIWNRMENGKKIYGMTLNTAFIIVKDTLQYRK